MQQANILLALGGDGGNQVPKYAVTPAEIAILQAIHGDQSVTEIEPLDDDVDRNNREELARLREIYARARVADGNGSSTLVMDALFPGALAKLPENFDDIDIPENAWKATERATARRATKSTKGKKADADAAKAAADAKAAQDAADAKAAQDAADAAAADKAEADKKTADTNALN